MPPLRRTRPGSLHLLVDSSGLKLDGAGEWLIEKQTAFVESAVNEIIAKRMNKKQQMRWNRATVQPFLDVRTAVLNDTLEDAFRRRYPGFRPANGDEVVALAA
jgi:hypothetical protein